MGMFRPTPAGVLPHGRVVDDLSGQDVDQLDARTITRSQVEAEILRLDALPDFRFVEEVANYLRRPSALKRAALHSDHLASWTLWALFQLGSTTRAKIDAAHDDARERSRLAQFHGLVLAERKIVMPFAKQALMLGNRNGDVFEALLRLAEEHQDLFQPILAKVREERKRRPKVKLKATKNNLKAIGATRARGR